jgi:hypothetical protein
MSIQAMAWAMMQQVVTDASARHVLLVLANYAGDEGRAAFPSAVTLSRDTGLSERTVRSKLDLLESEGAIVKGNQAIAAAYIERADRRPVCYDLVLTLTEKPAAENAPRDDERGAAVAGRMDERGANYAATGCNPCSNGVQPTHERGAAIVGNPSFNPSSKPSVNPKGYASPSGTQALFAEPPANSAPRTDKKSKPETFDAKAHLKANGVDDQVAADWMTVRKKKTGALTLTACKRIENDAAKTALRSPKL